MFGITSASYHLNRLPLGLYSPDSAHDLFGRVYSKGDGIQTFALALSLSPNNFYRNYYNNSCLSNLPILRLLHDLECFPYGVLTQYHKEALIYSLIFSLYIKYLWAFPSIGGFLAQPRFSNQHEALR